MCGMLCISKQIAIFSDILRRFGPGQIEIAMLKDLEQAVQGTSVKTRDGKKDCLSS
jgi:hypothetical protein